MFDPSTTIDSPCRRAMGIKSVENSKVFHWYGVEIRIMSASSYQVSSSSLDHGSNDEVRRPKDLVRLNSVTLKFTHLRTVTETEKQN
ncbi:hypothetical protein TNCV_2028141 [Trichonephila clavipes]|nr:hypothetical protein TNCV_2028141 [Trichonephila clavipes]